MHLLPWPPVLQVLAPQVWSAERGACSAMDACCWLPLVVAALGYERRRPQLVLCATCKTFAPIGWPGAGLPERVCWNQRSRASSMAGR